MKLYMPRPLAVENTGCEFAPSVASLSVLWTVLAASSFKIMMAGRAILHKLRQENFEPSPGFS